MVVLYCGMLLAKAGAINVETRRVWRNLPRSERCQRKELLGKTSDPRANTGLLAANILKAKKHFGGPIEITDLAIEIDSISYQS